jgi:Family of unknown function (DUF6401)
MPLSDFPPPLSAVSLRLADEVGQDVLDWVFSGDLAAAAQLDQHVAAVQAELAVVCQSGSATPHGPAVAAQLAGNAAVGARPSPAALRAVMAEVSCPDVPFADSAAGAWRAESVPPLRLLLHYACGFVEAAVRADWWPGESADADDFDWESVRLAAVCHLIRQAELAAAVHPDLR